MSKNNYYTTRNVLDYLYYQKYYKLIGTDLSRQKNSIIPQKKFFFRKLEEDNSVAIIFMLRNSKKLLENFL